MDRTDERRAGWKVTHTRLAVGRSTALAMSMCEARTLTAVAETSAEQYEEAHNLRGVARLFAAGAQDSHAALSGTSSLVPSGMSGSLPSGSTAQPPLSLVSSLSSSAHQGSYMTLDLSGSPTRRGSQMPTARDWRPSRPSLMWRIVRLLGSCLPWKRWPVA